VRLRLLAEEFGALEFGDGEEIDDRQNADGIHDNQDHKPDRLTTPARMPERKSLPKTFPEDQEWERGRDHVNARWCPDACPDCSEDEEHADLISGRTRRLPR